MVEKRSVNTFCSVLRGQELFDIVKNFEQENGYFRSDNETLFNCVQCFFLFNDKTKLSKQEKYYKGEINKTLFKNALDPLNTTKRSIIETNNNILRLKLPLVKKMSNGERDLLTFVASFLKIMTSNRNKETTSVIVCDEIFDYLDGSNLLYAQYFINNYIVRYKKDYPTFFIIMTHLSPDSFNTFTCSNMCVHYLDNSFNYQTDEDLLKILVNRPSSSTNFKDYFSRKYVHFNPDLSDEKVSGLNMEETKFLERFKIGDFYFFLKEEIQNYLAGQKFDPLAFCLGLRILCEEYQYSLINSEAQKAQYVATHATAKKTEFLASQNIEFDERSNLFSLFFNEAAHISSSNYENIIKQIMLRIDPKPIRNIINDYLKTYFNDDLSLR